MMKEARSLVDSEVELDRNEEALHSVEARGNRILAVSLRYETHSTIDFRISEKGYSALEDSRALVVS